MIELTIPGKPAPNRTIFGKRKAYKTKTVIDYKKKIQLIVREYCLTNMIEPIVSPAVLFLNINRGIPKSYSKKRRLGLVGQPAPVTPDSDNVLKVVKDAISASRWNGDYTLLADDKLVCEEHITKNYALEPSVVIKVGTIEGNSLKCPCSSEEHLSKLMGKMTDEIFKNEKI